MLLFMTMSFYFQISQITTKLSSVATLEPMTRTFWQLNLHFGNVLVNFSLRTLGPTVAQCGVSVNEWTGGQVVVSPKRLKSRWDASVMHYFAPWTSASSRP